MKKRLKRSLLTYQFYMDDLSDDKIGVQAIQNYHNMTFYIKNNNKFVFSAPNKIYLLVILE